ncbi:MAG: phage holin family protein [Acidimicrobiales bacterium]
MAVTPTSPVPTKPADDKSISTLAGELKDLVVAYAKQETIDPLKGLVRFIGFGVAGAVLLALGVAFISIAIVRALQYELAPHLGGHLSWVPYLGGVLLASVVAVLAVTRISKVPR